MKILLCIILACVSLNTQAQRLQTQPETPQCDNVWSYDHALVHRMILPPCPSEILLNYEDIQLQHHQYLDFADYTNAVEYEHMKGIRMVGFVWIKVQGKFFLLPYYTRDVKTP